MRSRTPLTVALATALSLSVSACSSSEDAASSSAASSSAASSSDSGSPSGGFGDLLQIDEVELDTDGSSAGGANTAAVAAATEAFLATLDGDLLDQVQYDFSDTTARQTWSNYPSAQVPREGVALSGLSEDQLTAALAMLDAALSDTGAQQNNDIRTADDYLATLGEDTFGSLVDYYVAVYGSPSETEPFMIQFGGHHLARNLTYNGDAVSQTPQFVGSEPTTFELEGTSYEPVRAESTTMFGMLSGLNEDQLAAAEITSGTFDDLLMGPGKDSGEFPDAEGIAVSELDEAQQQLVMDAITAYAGDLDDAAATALIAKYAAELDQTVIGWSNNTGPTQENSYIRIDGPSVWIEFINTRSRSTPDIHFHSVYRDKTNDYGSSSPAA